jgi:nitrogen fixation NifU-like protein
MANDLAELYQEVILDHSRHPRNAGKPDGADREARGNNPLCGDRVTVYLSVRDGRIADVGFDARGCAISIASASMMSEMLKGKTVEEAKALFERFHALVTGAAQGDGAAEGLDELGALAGVRDFPTRIKCATLPWHAMIAATENSDEEVRTE